MEMKKRANLLFADCEKIGEKLYFYITSLKVLIAWNICTQNIEIEYKVETSGCINVDTLINIAGNLYIFEINGMKMHRYSFKSEDIKSFDILCGKREIINYAAICKHKTGIYIFPRYTGNVIRFDLVSETIERINEDLYNEFKPDLKRGSFFSCGVQNENDVWLVPENGEEIIKYCLNENNYCKYKIKNIINNCVNIYIYNKQIFFLGSFGKILSWEIGNKAVVEIADLHSFEEEFGRLVVTNSFIFVLPLYGERIIIVNRINKKVYEYTDYPKDFKYYTFYEKPAKFWNYSEDEKYVWFAMIGTSYGLYIDKISEKIMWYSINIPLDVYVRNNVVVNEFLCNINLKEYIQYILNVDYNKDENKGEVVKSAIWNEIIADLK